MQKLARVALILVLSVAALQAAAQSAKPAPSSDTDDNSPRIQYCQNTGGLVEVRRPVYGTNNPPSAWLWLAGSQYFCQYTAADGSRIHVSLQTLTAQRPTLATLAYYAQVPWNGQGNGNPASFYCSQLGGSEIGATDFAGGAWVSAGGIDRTLETCIFPDNSTIDSWGLLYHSASIIRGIDLATVLRYAGPPKKK